MVKPLIRTTRAPPGDCLISRQEAAKYLGINIPRISGLVAKGWLFGRQNHPGKPGCASTLPNDR